MMVFLVSCVLLAMILMEWFMWPSSLLMRILVFALLGAITGEIAFMAGWP